LNGLDDAVEIGGDIQIPESQRTKPGAAEHRISHRVVVRLDVLSVLAPVHLDDEAVFEADEIQVKSAQRRLTAEMEAVGAEGPQLNPEPGFLRRQAFTKFAGAFDGAP
jgi:hypothetical protein